jgi:hypothetical protein
VVPRALGDVLAAAVVAARAAGDHAYAERLQAELAALNEARRTTSRLQASLLRGTVIGFGALARGFDTDVYERRLAGALARLLNDVPPHTAVNSASQTSLG